MWVARTCCALRVTWLSGAGPLTRPAQGLRGRRGRRDGRRDGRRSDGSSGGGESAPREVHPVHAVTPVHLFIRAQARESAIGKDLGKSGLAGAGEASHEDGGRTGIGLVRAWEIVVISASASGVSWPVRRATSRAPMRSSSTLKSVSSTVVTGKPPIPSARCDQGLRGRHRIPRCCPRRR